MSSITERRDEKEGVESFEKYGMRLRGFLDIGHAEPSKMRCETCFDGGVKGKRRRCCAHVLLLHGSIC